jgi:osmoprotectant transport system permease protein
MSLFDYLAAQGGRLFGLAIEHLAIVLVSVVVATIVGVTIGVLTYRTDGPRRAALAVTGIFLTIPSFALFGLLIPLFGLPIVRNTITGLRSVDPAIVESAQGMGMGRYRRLIRIELPLAWPIIITGIRVAAVIIVGIAAIAAVINGPGLGKDIFRALARVGTPTAVPQVLSAILGIVAIAIIIDFVFLVIARLTTSKGIRA